MLFTTYNVIQKGLGLPASRACGICEQTVTNEFVYLLARKAIISG